MKELAVPEDTKRKRTYGKLGEASQYSDLVSGCYLNPKSPRSPKDTDNDEFPESISDLTIERANVNNIIFFVLLYYF